jgi:transposase-like protein
MASRACRRLRRRAPPSENLKAYPIGYFHIDIAELRTAEGKLYLFVAIDRTSKFAFVALHEKADRPTAVRFLEALIAAVPYRLHTVLTDNGSSLPTCQKIAMAGPLDTGSTASIRSAELMASSSG